jgi:hypothetical protein
MALRALNSVVAANYNKQSTDPVLAGDLVAFNYGSANNSGLNPALVARACRGNVNSSSATTSPVGVFYRGQIIGVCADDALGTNPAGETPTMINNDPAGSNFLNGSVFQSYTAGFYVGAKRAISDFKDESIDVVTNLTAGIPTYSQRGVTVYNTPGSQFVTDRFGALTAAASSADTVGWTGSTGSTTPSSGDLLTIGANNATANSYASTPSAPTATSATASTNNAGLLVSAGSNSTIGTVANYIPVVGRVDFYDSGAGLMYWTLL